MLLILTTIRRLALLLLVFLVWTPAAYAWSWPVQGPVLQPFSYDEAHPYAAGQHRGVDIGAAAMGETVVAPAGGMISFAGTVATNGKTITIETGDGYSVTLTHLGSLAVVKGATVAEQDPVGSVGPSGTPEVNAPYVHLGIRLTADPNGYVDPLGLLPPAASEASTDTGTTAPQSASNGTASASPAARPASSAPRSARVATTHKARSVSARGHVRTQQHQRAQRPSSNARTSRSHHRPSARNAEIERSSSSRLPVSEPVAPRPVGLDAGHEPRPSLSIAQPRRKPSSPLLVLVCNWVAAVFALGIAFVAHGRRRLPRVAGAPVLRLPPPAVEHRHASRAA